MNTTIFPRFTQAALRCPALCDDPTPARTEARSEAEFHRAIRPRLLQDFANGRRHLWVEPSATRH